MANQTNDIVDVFISETKTFIRDCSIFSIVDEVITVTPTVGDNVAVSASNIAMNYSAQTRDNLSSLAQILKQLLFTGSTWDQCEARAILGSRGTISSEDLASIKAALAAEVTSQVSALNLCRRANL